VLFFQVVLLSSWETETFFPVMMRGKRAGLHNFTSIDLEGLQWFKNKLPPPTQAISDMRRAIAEHGVWTIRNHGVSEQDTNRVRTAGSKVFDRPIAEKMRFAVANMERSRGWEVYPHHRKHQARYCRIIAACLPLSFIFCQTCTCAARTSTNLGILCFSAHQPQRMKDKCVYGNIFATLDLISPRFKSAYDHIIVSLVLTASRCNACHSRKS
jgi:hypothetical protein